MSNSATIDLIQLLRTDTTMGALLATAGSVWHRRAPQGSARPFVVVSRQTEVGRSHLTGPADLRQPLYTFDAIADTGEDAQLVADQIDVLLNGTRGLVGTIWLSGATLTDQRDSDNEAVPGSEARRFLVSSDYEIGWRATA